MFFLGKNASNRREQVIKDHQVEIFTEKEKSLLNLMQKDFGFAVDQYSQMAIALNISEEELLQMLSGLSARGVITRVGPFFNLDRSSGYVSLVAMKIPEYDFERVVTIVNSFYDVAHNYQRANQFNMWFVLASSSEAEAMSILKEIEQKTGYQTYNLPKLKEFALDLFLEV